MRNARLVHGKAGSVADGLQQTNEHPRERTKPGGKGGRHTQGVAVDCLVYGEDALDLISLALKHGFNGIGVSQKGDFNSRFIHLDIRQESSPAIWSY
jgi:uncharacterized protein YcbK (DUF882 family)